MSKSKHILTDFEALLLEAQTNFSLMTLYKGVPVNTHATLQKVEGEIVWFSVRPPGLAFAQPGSHLLILSNGYLEPVDGQVVRWDHDTANIGLSELVFAGGKYGIRHELRVEPQETFCITLMDAGQFFRVEGVDISLHGLGVWLNGEKCPPELVPGKELGIEIEFPQELARLQGRILKANPLDFGWRFSIEFTSSAEEKRRVLHYIMHRRDEIFSEIHGQQP